MIIYPELDTLRDLYSKYAHKQIKEDNEIVLINPFYETTDSVREVLSEKFNVPNYEKEESLMIADALEEYLGDEPHKHFKKSLANCTEMGKRGVSVLADLGAYSHTYKHDELIDYELSLPTNDTDIPMKGFCLYHRKDFDKFSDDVQQKLIEDHGTALKIVETP